MNAEYRIEEFDFRLDGIAIAVLDVTAILERSNATYAGFIVTALVVQGEGIEMSPRMGSWGLRIPKRVQKPIRIEPTDADPIKQAIFEQVAVSLEGDADAAEFFRHKAA